MKLSRMLLVLTLSTPFIFSAWATHATEADTPFNVLLTLTPACTLSTANDIHFDIANINSPDETASSSVSITCPYGMAYNLAMLPANQDHNGAGNMMNQTDASQITHYNLYQDAADSIIWGDEVGINTEAATGTGLPQNYGIHAKISHTEFVHSAGNYSDHVAIKLLY